MMVRNRGSLIIFFYILFIQRSTQITSNDDGNSSPMPPAPASVPDPGIQETKRLSLAINEFGYKLMLNMMEKDVDKNVLLSPTGITGLLAMTLLGSVGSTYEELATVIGFSQDILENRRNHHNFGNLLQELNTNPNREMNKTADINENSTIADDLTTKTLYADAIVVDAKTQIRNIYRDYLDRVYHGDALSVNFRDTAQSLKVINEWVKNHTTGKIENFLQEPLPLQSKVVLLSALYFSGQWARPFLEEFTRDMPFHKPSGNITTKLMLNMGEFNYTYQPHYGVHIMAVPYNDSITKMYILKPVKTKKPLLEVLQALNYETIERLIENMTVHTCVLRFPKMDLSSKAELSNSLKDLGIKSLFSPTISNLALMVDVENQKNDADDFLTGIYYKDEEKSNKLKKVVYSLPNPGIYVDSVMHDVKMTINEYGTVAVAATSGLLSRTAKLFYADSPFYMFIRNEKTKLVTFSGVIFDPSGSS